MLLRLLIKKLVLLIIAPEERTFVLGGQLRSDGAIIFLGGSVLNAVKILPEVSKDICLFEGKFIPNEEIFPSTQDFFDAYSSIVPRIVRSGTQIQYSTTTMYHYSFGVKEKRRTKGEVTSGETYTISTLFGSSGAALFHNENEIYGIHISAHFSSEIKDRVQPTQFVLKEGREVPKGPWSPVTTHNIFEQITRLDYISMKLKYGGGF